MARVEAIAGEEDVARTIVRHLATRVYDELPSRAIAATKEHILHTVTTIIGGSATDGIAEVVALADELSGPAESTIFVHGRRVTSLYAALANGTMGHALDFDCNDDRIALKPSVTPVSAGFAIAERIGGVTGRNFITAVCLGVDLSIRIGLACEPKPRHVLTQAVGCFGAAATAAKLMGFDEEQLYDALGIAFSQAAPGGLTTVAGSLSKRLGVGMAARNGVFAALLAQKGYRGPRHPLDGSRGYFQVFTGREGDLSELTAELGERYEIVNVSAKPYPSCRYTHGPIEGTLRLRQEHELTPEAIERMVVRLSPQAYASVGGGGDPVVLARRRRPTSVVDAQFSAPFTMATAIVRGRVFVESFADSALADPEVLRLAARVEPVVDRTLDNGRLISPTVVEVECRDGRRLQAVVEYPKGSPENPMRWDDLEASFKAVLPFAARPLAPDQAAEALRLLTNLEAVDDVALIVAYLLGTPVGV